MINIEARQGAGRGAVETAGYLPREALLGHLGREDTPVDYWKESEETTGQSDHPKQC